MEGVKRPSAFDDDALTSHTPHAARMLLERNPPRRVQVRVGVGVGVRVGVGVGFRVGVRVRVRVRVRVG